MSGGSFEYLCLWDVETHACLEDMAFALSEGSPERTETEAIATAIRELNDRIRKVSDVWKAVEWERSGDWGEDQMMRAIADYRATLNQCSSAEAASSEITEPVSE